ncbi:unnamed protein product [Haemonchus placei]|uniref:SCP domain-containing protein n=1 Tax=Haemonchus placei TaxID=6290 RepID=A0A0N4VSP4_HAEPC|nr:unnamed protein product [Haemonchus placei]
MFFIITAVALLIPYVTVQGSHSTLSQSGIEGLKKLSTKYNSNLNWNEDLAKKASEWMTKKAPVKAGVTYRGKRCIPKTEDKEPATDMIISTFAESFEKEGKKIAAVGGGLYGCSGFVDRRGKKRSCIYVGCLFSKLADRRFI